VVNQPTPCLCCGKIPHPDSPFCPACKLERERIGTQWCLFTVMGAPIGAIAAANVVLEDPARVLAYGPSASWRLGLLVWTLAGAWLGGLIRSSLSDEVRGRRE
jgi:hypothetical protein